MKFYVIADENTVTGFNLVGLEGESVESPEGARQRTYWLEQLKGNLPPLECPPGSWHASIELCNGLSKTDNCPGQLSWWPDTDRSHTSNPTDTETSTISICASTFFTSPGTH